MTPLQRVRSVLWSLRPNDLRDEPYWASLAVVARCATDAVAVLERVVTVGAHPADADGIQRLRLRARAESHALTARLHRARVTPLEPHTLQVLASSIDELVESILDATASVGEYELPAGDVDSIQLAILARRAVDDVARGIDALSARRPRAEVFAICQAVSVARDAAQESAPVAFARLARAGGDAMQALRCGEIYRAISVISDRAEHVGFAIEEAALEEE